MNLVAVKRKDRPVKLVKLPDDWSIRAMDVVYVDSDSGAEEYQCVSGSFESEDYKYLAQVFNTEVPLEEVIGRRLIMWADETRNETEVML